MKAIIDHVVYYALIEFNLFEPYNDNFSAMQNDFDDWLATQYDEEGNLKELPKGVTEKYPDGTGVVYWMNLVSKNANAKLLKEGDVNYIHQRRGKPIIEYVGLSEDEKDSPVIMNL